MGAPGMEMIRSEGKVSGPIPGRRTRSWRKVARHEYAPEESAVVAHRRGEQVHRVLVQELFTLVFHPAAANEIQHLVRVHHALGLAGGPGREADVGQRARIHRRRPIQHFSVRKVLEG
jgi:hypothetical protein